MDNLFARYSLKGKVALVVGASRGMGEGIAMTYASAGARVVVASRKAEDIQETAAKILASGGQAIAVPSNIASEEDRSGMVKAAMDWAGRIDILFNNAGANPSYGPPQKLQKKAWDKTYDINLSGPFFLSQLVFDAWMKDHGGVIINMGSVAGLTSVEGTLPYNVSKAALLQLTRNLAAEWGKYGIRVNAIAPGFIKTQFSRLAWESPISNELMKHIPLKRFGEVEDITAAALFLASDASSYITGTHMIIDGGELIKFQQGTNVT